MAQGRHIVYACPEGRRRIARNRRLRGRQARLPEGYPAGSGPVAEHEVYGIESRDGEQTKVVFPPARVEHGCFDAGIIFQKKIDQILGQRLFKRLMGAFP